MLDKITLKQAIVDLKTKTSHNYYATTNKYGFNTNIFKNCFTSRTASKSSAQIKANDILNFTQKKVLVNHINYFFEQKMLPTLQYVVNLVQEIIKKKLTTIRLIALLKNTMMNSVTYILIILIMHGMWQITIIILIIVLSK